ncbi:MAG: thiamine pyrophosphate-dependent enzyme [Anaerolineae bacterium]|nr:thiamine pyrophosphate-dependent enzyme [Anaerolineae bacterium]MDW8070305.1 thiamine pyrophosphate-dependent enzyme [Anaerolineae bacterium]
MDEQVVVVALQEQKVYSRPRALTAETTNYCPGCTHGLINKLIAEVIDELGIQENTISVSPVGCAVFFYRYLVLDGVVAPHGRAPAVATGIKRMLPDRVVITYQGDGDMAAIGMSEIVWTAMRGENITAFFVNNANYGMTGGQMAPTTLAGQVTTTSPQGRDVETMGMPTRMAEMLAGLPGSAYVARCATYDARTIRDARNAIRLALRAQMAGAGFSMVEFLSSCPTNWGLSPQEALQWIKQTMVAYYPLGEFKVSEAVQRLKAKR